MAKNMDKIVGGIFVVAILVAVGVFAYYNLYSNHSGNSGKETGGEVLLTVYYGDERYNYTLSDLKKIDEFTGTGGYKTSHGDIKGVKSYTGVRMIKFLDGFNLPGEYEIQVIASDNYSVNYTMDEILGNVTTYDTSGNESGAGGVTMLLAYAEDGEYNFDDGPLRIAYVDDGKITSSRLWVKQVVEIKIIEI